MSSLAAIRESLSRDVLTILTLFSSELNCNSSGVNSGRSRTFNTMSRWRRDDGVTVPINNAAGVTAIALAIRFV